MNQDNRRECEIAKGDISVSTEVSKQEALHKEEEI